ncbi:MAG TPA: hypothetical protein VFB21_13160, partial [Chthonomonadaceae bacterium]|nr:hypothetical protein [Chthonomonadaceae bacterium]
VRVLQQVGAGLVGKAIGMSWRTRSRFFHRGTLLAIQVVGTFGTAAIVPGMGKEIQGWTPEEEGEFPFAEPEGVWRRRRFAAPCGIRRWRNLP